MDTNNLSAIAIGARIRSIRRDAKLTQQAFAKALTSAYQQCTASKQGSVFQTRNCLSRSGKSFDADLNRLLTGEGDKSGGAVNAGDSGVAGPSNQETVETSA